jgi:predicted N-formylglutamate amidohydrolase
MKTTIPVISCEHAGNDIPNAYLPLFAQQEAILNTHRAFDIGAFDIAEALYTTCQCPHVHTTISRLLIDCNRSLSNRALFSEFTQSLSSTEKQTLIDTHYLPYRKQAEDLIQQQIDQGKQVLHLSIHTFTPMFKEKPRTTAIGLLYDPHRHGEKEVARVWSSLLTNYSPCYRVRMNYPYRGVSDGFTSLLRKQHPEDHYLGIEVEINQALLQDQASFSELNMILSDSLVALLQLL